MDEKEQIIECFDLWMKDAGFTESTQKAYRYIINEFLHMNIKPLNEIKKYDILMHLGKMRLKNCSDQARNRKLFALRTFFKAMVQLELVSHNPALEINVSRTMKNQTPSFLEEKQVIKLLDKFSNKRNKAIFSLMVYAGLRVGEVHRLDLEHFHIEQQTLYVMGKGRKWRTIFLPQSLSDMIETYIEERKKPNSSKVSALFISQKGNRLSIRQIQQIAWSAFNNFSKTNQKLSCHKLRHTFATLLLNKGVDIRVVKELMGHESIQTTMIYTHVQESQKKKAMSALEQIIEK